MYFSLWCSALHTSCFLMRIICSSLNILLSFCGHFHLCEVVQKIKIWVWSSLNVWKRKTEYSWCSSVHCGQDSKTGVLMLRFYDPRLSGFKDHLLYIMFSGQWRHLRLLLEWEVTVPSKCWDTCYLVTTFKESRCTC